MVLLALVVVQHHLEALSALGNFHHQGFVPHESHAYARHLTRQGKGAIHPVGISNKAMGLRNFSNDTQDQAHGQISNIIIGQPRCVGQRDAARFERLHVHLIKTLTHHAHPPHMGVSGEELGIDFHLAGAHHHTHTRERSGIDQMPMVMNLIAGLQSGHQMGGKWCEF